MRVDVPPSLGQRRDGFLQIRDALLERLDRLHGNERHLLALLEDGLRLLGTGGAHAAEAQGERQGRERQGAGRAHQEWLHACTHTPTPMLLQLLIAARQERRCSSSIKGSGADREQLPGRSPVPQSRQRYFWCRSYSSRIAEQPIPSGAHTAAARVKETLLCRDSFRAMLCASARTRGERRASAQ